MLGVFEATKQAIRDQGWRPFPGPALVEVWFRFPNYRGDLDGPIKRTLDAVQDGINEVFGPRSFDDGRVKDLILHKVNVRDEGGRTGITVELRKWSRPSSRLSSSSSSAEASDAGSSNPAWAA